MKVKNSIFQKKQNKIYYGTFHSAQEVSLNVQRTLKCKLEFTVNTYYILSLRHEISQSFLGTTGTTEIKEKHRAALEDFFSRNQGETPVKDLAYNPELAKRLHQEKINVLMPRLEAESKKVLQKDFSPNKDWWNSKLTED